MNSYFDDTDKSEKDNMTVTAGTEQTEQFYQRGLGLKKEVQAVLNKDYHSNIVECLRANKFTLAAGDVTIFLAQEFGFCYGVDRAVDYAYQTREKFPDRRIFLTGEIIHNPYVNNRLLEMDIQFLGGQYGRGQTIDDLLPEDVVILPAFGVSISEFQNLKARGCILVDTTCGSVLNVWKRVGYYARNGYTSIIHGKYAHEETIATSSQALRYPNGKYLVVRNMEEAQRVCDYILKPVNKPDFMAYFARCMSPNFDPDSDLDKVGVANQTTMLSSESLAIADHFNQTMRSRFGDKEIDEHFQTFDTICSATQDRQDAVLELVQKEKLDLMLVIGGFNSSNTNHLAELTESYTRTYHIDDAACLISAERIRHKAITGNDVVESEGWLPKGKLNIGLTAGASTPNNKIGEIIERVLFFRGTDVAQIIDT